jgi:hypothetical protein
MSCELLNSCTGVVCCIDVPLINRALQVSLQINQNTQTLQIGIEKLNMTVSLLDFKYGKL